MRATPGNHAGHRANPWPLLLRGLHNLPRPMPAGSGSRLMPEATRLVKKPRRHLCEVGEVSTRPTQTPRATPRSPGRHAEVWLAPEHLCPRYSCHSLAFPHPPSQFHSALTSPPPRSLPGPAGLKPGTQPSEAHTLCPLAVAFLPPWMSRSANSPWRVRMARATE